MKFFFLPDELVREKRNLFNPFEKAEKLDEDLIDESLQGFICKV